MPEAISTSRSGPISFAGVFCQSRAPRGRRAELPGELDRLRAAAAEAGEGHLLQRRRAVPGGAPAAIPAAAHAALDDRGASSSRSGPGPEHGDAPVPEAPRRHDHLLVGEPEALPVQVALGADAVEEDPARRRAARCGISSTSWSRPRCSPDATNPATVSPSAATAGSGGAPAATGTASTSAWTSAAPAAVRVTRGGRGPTPSVKL